MFNRLSKDLKTTTLAELCMFGGDFNGKNDVVMELKRRDVDLVELRDRISNFIEGFVAGK